MTPHVYWSLLAMALVSGALMPLQAGINGLLAKEVSSVLNAATISFLVGTLALLFLDNQGWVGFKEIPINLGKIAGLLLILGGIWVIRRS